MLLKGGRFYGNDLVLDLDTFKEIESKRKCFDSADLIWTDYTKLNKNVIPNGFGLDVITKFLTETFIKAYNDQNPVETGIENPAKKGSQMYKSKKVQMVEWSIDKNLILFRAHVMGSLKQELR